ncbi:hypothetical protein BD324DRAFT_652075 [Kockovaella imperatae]|uniref:Phage tail collar domain-containing protein n=1 Tax=Kockovaella imperatae TaxID=4999 RepID=A0A1Y1UBY3_9TREE|nr:hypothetical protein BD324DRAFT_652075 [Kockovaella imperatae]ORX35522.1 hypothetical protein BD324DRAFT_652075 [Kockovaella imperatae]
MTLGVPCGTIVAYCGEKSSVPSNWSVCDGTSYQRDKFPALYAMIGTANGSDGGSFRIPDLAGRFLRGWGMDNGGKKDFAPYEVNPIFRALFGSQIIAGPPQPLTPGATFDSRTGYPRAGLRMKLSQLPKENQYHNTGKGNGDQLCDITDDSTLFTGTEGDAETRPDNVYMYYIIKIQDGDTDTMTPADLPAGAIFPFAGGETCGPALESNSGNAFILCDGGNVDATAAADLQGPVGNRFAAVNDADTKFTPPDLVNWFIRGIDETSLRDKEAKSRIRAPDGSDQGRGTTQKWATKFTKPFAVVAHLQTKKEASSGGINEAGWNCLKADGWVTEAFMEGGDDETRPDNKAVRFYLNPDAPTKEVTPTIPIGGIIALPGDPDLGSSSIFKDFGNAYLPCDGSERSSADFKALSALIKSIWGDASGDDKFRLPDLRGQYLRGAGKSQRQTGSAQVWSTGLPSKTKRNMNVNAISYPTAMCTVGSAMGWGFRNTAYEYLSAGTVDISFDDDGETAPACVVVKFYVRAV